jgi:hypothetical protein
VINYSHNSYKKGECGQTFLALVFLIGGIILLVSVTLAFLTNSFIDTGYGYKASLSSQATAASGVQDAILQLNRNINFSTSGYSVVVGSSTATVVVTQNSPSTGFVNVLSSANVSGHVKKINVILAESTTTDSLSVVSWQNVQ